MDPDATHFQITPGGVVHLRGKIKLVPDESLTGQRVVNLPLPDDIRPRVEADFEVECGTGTTVVTVMPDGSVLVDPNVGWFSLEGITFQLGGG